MGFKDSVARLDDVLLELDKGKSLRHKELKRLEQALHFFPVLSGLVRLNFVNLLAIDGKTETVLYSG